MSSIAALVDTADSDARDELAALRARRAELEARRAELEAPTPAEELEAERRAVADAEAINAAIQEHGRLGVKIMVVESSIGKVIVKRCSAARYKKFQDEGDFSSVKCEVFVRPNIVYPTLSIFDQMIEDQPMIAARCCNALSKMAGVQKEDVEKK